MALTEAPAPRRGGRPTRLEAARLADRILDVATELFLSHGFGATSIEGVTRRARISKRTFYSRFRDKAELFRAVIARLLAGWLPRFEAAFEAPGTIEQVLTRSARRMLDVATGRDALALRRLLLAEAERFPELAPMIAQQGGTRGIERIAGLLAEEVRAGRLDVPDCAFAATQFQDMVLSVPLRRAMGFGAAMSGAELDDWAARTVALFLYGCRPRAGA